MFWVCRRSFGENVEKAMFSIEKHEPGAYLILDTSKHAIIPCSPASTTQPQLLQVPGLAAAAGSDRFHGAARAGPAQQRRSPAYQALPLTAALRRAERADGLIFRNADRFSQRAVAAHCYSRRRERALDVLGLCFALLCFAWGIY